MDPLSKRRKLGFRSKRSLHRCFLVPILCFSAFALFASAISHGNTRLSGESPNLVHRSVGSTDSAQQQVNGAIVGSKVGRGGLSSRRCLSGPGSSPPRCVSKCGKCTPCKPVHVPVPPGTPVTTEYYPEAWRCKCGNRLYMP
ncbi:hypothetical protein AMTRI_Chr12g272440 [Amborella trichopoda]|uniref:Epidermal patterning factor-like protein n=1 Tax=Amborella trichopoda TaxID=13333 RepID=U5DDS7_AMBTC|nr:EPIDERMAL PATTERNING FACTOR-like protein 4 [Amborella trichopoda]ERN18543.1 hypothetical protein AMTR_s00065p00086000 [Amborella trichopoda]|eukprot:XP_006857076.1 EPIDERMAL PATTERNING FACTOR-like protein 4 [Amborella trichopoda]